MLCVLRSGPAGDRFCLCAASVAGCTGRAIATLGERVGRSRRQSWDIRPGVLGSLMAMLRVVVSSMHSRSRLSGRCVFRVLSVRMVLARILGMLAVGFRHQILVNIGVRVPIWHKSVVERRFLGAWTGAFMGVFGVSRVG